MKLPHVSSVIFSLFACSPTPHAGEVVLDYEARVRTVPAGTPFGLSVQIGTMVSGSFVYESSEATDTRSSPNFGVYLLPSGGGFSALILDHEVTGSVIPVLNIDFFDFAAHTFRYVDGALQNQFPLDRGVMAFDGVPADDIGVSFAISDASRMAFSDDSIPIDFPMEIEPGVSEFPHTFNLSDGQGGMLLEVTRLEQRLPTAPTITEVGFEGDVPFIEFESQPDSTYDIEFSTDLETWELLAEEFPADGFTTDFIDDGIVGRLGELPGNAYYRVRESG